MSQAEFPKISDLTDRGRLFVSLVGGIATIVLTQEDNTKLVEEISSAAQKIGKFTSAELGMAMKIGVVKGNGIRNRYQAIKEQINQSE